MNCDVIPRGVIYSFIKERDACLVQLSCIAVSCTLQYRSRYNQSRFHGLPFVQYQVIRGSILNNDVHWNDSLSCFFVKPTTHFSIFKTLFINVTIKYGQKPINGELPSMYYVFHSGCENLKKITIKSYWRRDYMKTIYSEICIIHHHPKLIYFFHYQIGGNCEVYIYPRAKINVRFAAVRTMCVRVKCVFARGLWKDSQCDSPLQTHSTTIVLM